MTKSTHPGRAIFAIAIAAMGTECLIRGDVVPGLEPIVSSATVHLALGWITGIILIVAASATLPRASARYGGFVLALVMFLWVILLHLPTLAAAPKNGSAWTSAFESFALAGAALVLAGLATHSSQETYGRPRIAARACTVGRLCYGVSLPVFGLLHFLYLGYVSSVIPTWIPAHLFWAYATGVAHVAAGVGIITGVVGRLAALGAAAMFGVWVLILHAPRVLAHPHDANEWTSLLVALAMCGGALLIAGALATSATSDAPGACT